MPRRTRPAYDTPAWNTHLPSGDVRMTRPHLAVEDLCVGCIVWLPEKEKEAKSILCNKPGCGLEELDDRAYNHPVLVLRVRQTAGSVIRGHSTCSVACVTTFSNTSLQKYSKMRLRRPHLQSSLPICHTCDTTVNSNTHAGIRPMCTNDLAVHLENRKLQKQSYIRLQHTYEVPLHTLRQFSFRRGRAYKVRLSNDGYNSVMAELGLLPDNYESTSALFGTASCRPNALENSHSIKRVAPQISANFDERSFPSIAVTPFCGPQRVYGADIIYIPTSVGSSHQDVPGSYLTIDQLSSRTHIPQYRGHLETADEGAGLVWCLVGIAVVSGLLWWKYGA